MEKDTVELLEITDFLSIKKIRWEVGNFNIITGDMGTGKSLCIKLLQFFEDIIPNLLVLPYEDLMNYLNSKNLFDFLIDKFQNTFVFQTPIGKKHPHFQIDYTFSYKEENFFMSIIGEKKGIIFKSLSLENLLGEWGIILNGIVPEKITVDGLKETKLSLCNDLLKRYGNYFPMATTFVPASRAALAFGSIHNDHYLNDYKRLVDNLRRYLSNGDEMINTILKAKIVIADTIYLVSDDGRKVPIINASSGQQEIVYVLLLLDRLGNFHYTYGKYHSLFIEEPEAHLFPLEQKQVIELIVKIYNYLKGNGNPIRVFITTHSPYILNSLSNILKKGFLLIKYKEQEDRINNVVDIPYLNADEIAAYFIDINGTWDDMLDEKGKYLNAEKIAKISYDIDEVSVKLSELNNELLSEGEN